MKILASVVVSMCLGPVGWPQTGGGELEEGVKHMATQLANTMAQANVRTIAVVEFSDLSGYSSTLGLFLAEELTTQLFEVKPGAFDVVERQQLLKVLAEQKLSSSSLFDAGNIENIGRILGIQAIVTGTFADLGQEIKINARSISVSTAKVFAATSARSPKNETVQTLMRQGSPPGRVTPAADPNAPVGRLVQASDVFFQNSFLRGMVDSLAISKDRNTAVLGVTLENLSAEDLLIALEKPKVYASSTCQARLVGTGGETYEPGQQDVAGIICFEAQHLEGEGWKSRPFTRLTARSRTTVTFKMRLQTVPERIGTSFSFGASFLRLHNGVVTRFSVGIPGIQATS